MSNRRTCTFNLFSRRSLSGSCIFSCTLKALDLYKLARHSGQLEREILIWFDLYSMSNCTNSIVMGTQVCAARAIKIVTLSTIVPSLPYNFERHFLNPATNRFLRSTTISNTTYLIHVWLTQINCCFLIIIIIIILLLFFRLAYDFYLLVADK